MFNPQYSLHKVKMLNIMKTKTLLMDMMVMKKMGNMISWMLNEEFGKVEEELGVESDEAEQGGEDEEEDGDFIDSEFEKSDEEDDMNFHRYVVTEEKMMDIKNQECREAIKYYACRCARRLRFVKNELNRVRLVCDGNKECDKAKRPTKGEKTKRHAKGDKAKRVIVRVIRVRGMVRVKKVKRVKMNMKINLKTVLGYYMLHMLGKGPLLE
ncbi:hypothetical protein L3X38_042712 [Prunus dulcis]|uniref:Uncharacterized protein n=1 Tax=Prunus dulcis TaxID=3755 RepID=A0AAD4YLG7_PRUDU|nr:hypothetical protein L3X38_042712 [Prunus dulcis]